MSSRRTFVLRGQPLATAVLGDFGLARVVSKSDPMTAIVSTLWYRAPEVVVSGVYEQPLDVWSFSITAVDMETGKPPCIAASEIGTLWATCNMLGTPPSGPIWHRLHGGKSNLPVSGVWNPHSGCLPRED